MRPKRVGGLEAYTTSNWTQRVSLQSFPSFNLTLRLNNRRACAGKRKVKLGTVASQNFQFTSPSRPSGRLGVPTTLTLSIKAPELVASSSMHLAPWARSIKPNGVKKAYLTYSRIDCRLESAVGNPSFKSRDFSLHNKQILLATAERMNAKTNAMSHGSREAEKQMCTWLL